MRGVRPSSSTSLTSSFDPTCKKSMASQEMWLVPAASCLLRRPPPRRHARCCDDMEERLTHFSQRAHVLMAEDTSNFLPLSPCIPSLSSR
eukprot:scaffold139462_cov31-Tisochrysis_lutea.AAC.1